MEPEERQRLTDKAKRLEGKMLYVKAAEIYLSLGMEEEAAKALETAGAFDKAASLFAKLGNKEGAARCQKKRDAAATGQTWQDAQADFQKDGGNPY